MHQALVDLVYHEARLIDEKRFDEWYELFAPEAFYWIPLARGQTDALNHNSLCYEDKFLLKLRIERLKNPRSYSQHVPSYCQHVLQQPSVESSDETQQRYVLRTPFLYLETQGDEQLLLGGVTYHHLVQVDGRLLIQLKKVELVNCDGAFPSIQLFP